MLQSHSHFAIAASVLALATTVAPSAIDSTRAAARRPTTVAAPLDSAILEAYRWRGIGPDRGGRSIAATGVRRRPSEAYFGATGGGLWKTTDGGDTWTPVTDGQIGSASVGAVAVSESNPDIVYIGMGETCIRGNIMAGDGVYKSTDAGKTWRQVGFDGGSKQNISKIRIHPTNPDIVWVAVFGFHGAPNEERGVFKTTDGGRTWKKVLYRDDKTGAIDLAVDRSNPNVLYAALWEAYRVEYQMSSGGPGSGFYKSTDGGETWTEITRNQGLPTGVVGRIGVDVSGADPNRVYALIENENGGLFSSDDAGATWKLVNADRRIRQRAFYYTHITADPKNRDVVYALNTALFKSTDGGTTLTSVGQGTHGDHHDLWIDPDDPEHLVDGNDGGGAISTRGGRGWSPQDFPTAQFYHAVTTKHVPFHVCGSQQDNSTACVSSALPGGFGGGGGGRGGNPLYVVGGGEPGYIAPDPKDLDVFYGGTNNGGFLTRFNRRTGQLREVNPYPRMFQGEPSSAVKERWQWTYPIIFSPVDPNVLYTSSQHVWKTTNGGQTWTKISGDLTRHDPKTMGHSGGPITGDMNGPEIYAVVFALGPGKKNVNVIWAGSDDGLIHVTRNGGQTWTNVTPKDMPEFGRVSQIDASSFDDGRAYVAVKRPLLNDVAPYIYRTTDFGRTWTKIVTGIRPNDYVHVVREDPTRRGLLYAGTQHGVYISYDDGASWQPFSLNLPDVPISDLIVESNAVALGTHGRSFYVLDNLEALRQYTPAVASSSEPHLFAPATATRPVTQAAIRYWLRQPARSLTIDILDGTGKVIRTYTGVSPDSARADSARRAAGGGAGGGGGGGQNRPQGPSMAAGVNTHLWDLRHAPAVTFPGMILWGATTNGPMAIPGTYRIRLTVDGKTLTQPVTIRKHPLYTDVTLADLREQLELALQIRDKVSEANNAVIQIRDLKKQTTERLAKSQDPALKAAGDSLAQHLSQVEEAIYQVRNQSGQDPLNFPIRINNRLATLLRTVTTGDAKPIGAARPIFNDLSAELKVETDRLAKVLADDLVRLNGELRRVGLPEVSLAKPTVS
ncbi:MAG: glycosyl hydrolase repeat-containing protein [Geminicoccaceae bacterium]|nr:glycosyl hydrolase repeat-containing protein [Geminicoccaceae bacterium]